VSHRERALSLAFALVATFSLLLLPSTSLAVSCSLRRDMPDMSISPTSTLHDDRSSTHTVAAKGGPDMAEKGRAAAAPYDGEGTADKPYIVKWHDGEKENPQNWTPLKKWCVQGPSRRRGPNAFSVRLARASPRPSG